MSIFKYIIIIILFCPMLSMGQNLLPNPSFEDTTIRVNPNHSYLPVGWTTATREGFNYLTPLHNSYDARYGAPYNFPGYQEARTGKAYIGTLIYHLHDFFLPNHRNPRREYMQAKLNRELKKDSTYCFQIYLSLADSVRFASRGQLGVYFSTDAVYEDHWHHLPYTPQLIVSPDDYVIDKEVWALYSSEYVASGGEEYITIGNFNDTTSIDTIYVGGGDSSNINYINTYYYIDDVFLGHCDSLPDTTTSIIEKKVKSKFKLYPNPVGEQFYLDYNGQEQLQFQLYNLMGQKVEAAVQKEGDRYRFSTAHLPKGVYLLRVNNGTRDETFKLIKK